MTCAEGCLERARSIPHRSGARNRARARAHLRFRPSSSTCRTGAGVCKHRGGGRQCRAQSPSRRRRATARHSRPEVGARRPQGAEASTQRPRRPLRVEVGPFAAREQDRFWVSLLRGGAGLSRVVFLTPSSRSPRRLVSGIPLRTLRTLREVSSRRRAACGGVRGGAPPDKPDNVRPSAAGCREASRSGSVFRPRSVFLFNAEHDAACPGYAKSRSGKGRIWRCARGRAPV